MVSGLPRHGFWLAALYLLVASACGNGKEVTPVDLQEIGDARASTEVVLDSIALPEALSEAQSSCTDQCANPIDGGEDLPDLVIQDLTPEITDAVVEVVADLSPDLGTEDLAPDVQQPAPFHHPALWGPYEIGARTFQLFDAERQRIVPITVWYPALPSGQALEKYLMLVEGKAYQDAPTDKSGAPYPVVLFSHGFNGISWQSISFTNYIASHGYIVVATDHKGNTLFDFNADDELVAQVALERPRDLRFALQEVVAMSVNVATELAGMAEPFKVAVTGHSFGGYTALMAAGGNNDVDKAKAECDAGAPSDIFCPYINYWPAGQTVSLDPPIPGLKAVACLAPGGYSAFGDAGLAEVFVPALIFGGSLDPTTPVDIEIDPIYAALGTPKYKAIVLDASHMSFTNICDLPPAQYFLDEFCGVEGMLENEETFPPVNALTVAFLNYYVRGETQYGGFLSQDYLDEAFGFVSFSREE